MPECPVSAAERIRAREALEVARQRHAALGLMISEMNASDGGALTAAMIHHNGQKEILDIFEAAISGDWPDPVPLPKRLYGDERAEDELLADLDEERGIAMDRLDEIERLNEELE